MRPDQLGDLAVFAAIASDRSFTRAARRLGVTQSALSQTMKRLESQLGFGLLSRTTRSVAPTAAGERLLAILSPALAGLDDEIEALSQARGAAIGTVRITTGKHAADTLLWPMLPSFMRRHPGIEAEVCVEGAMTDVVAGRYDAGIRLGERLEKDMIALAAGPPLRVAVVAAPGYLSDHPEPMKPADLTSHRCVAYGDAHGDRSPWSFERDGHAVKVTPGRGPVFNDADLLGIPLRLTVGGKGIKSGALELKLRRNGEMREIPLAQAAPAIREVIEDEIALIRATLKPEPLA